MASQHEFDEVTSKLCEVLLPAGFQCYAFKVGWYNDQVAPQFILQHPPDTVAFIVISTPSVFEKAFLPFIQNGFGDGARDPIDECMAHYFKLAKQALGGRTVRALHDFELAHSRRPLVLVQTAGHVAGAARYYQRTDVTNDPWRPDKQIFGVSVHPEYGGWFALRGVLILPDLQYQDLQQRVPPDVVPDDTGRIELLNRFNGNWQDWTYRDIIPVKERYSDLQKLYFATSPRDRKQLIERLKAAMPGAGRELYSISGHTNSRSRENKDERCLCDSLKSA